MDEDTIKLFAQNLRKPEGEAGLLTAERMNTGNKEMNHRTIEQLNVSPGDNILEVGMGNGFFVKDILSADSSVKYAGIDYSGLMVEEAGKLNKQFTDSGRALFFLTTADKLPFDDGSFNKLFTVNTIYFWDDPGKTLHEFHRVLKPGGMLIITHRPKREMETLPFTKHGFTMYSKEESSELISKNGFKVIMVDEREEMGLDINGEEIKRESVLIYSQKI